jgi:trimeric autotransporter adhesin
MYIYDHFSHLSELSARNFFAIKTMTHIFKTVSLTKLNKICDVARQALLVGAALFGFLALPTAVHAQAAACVAGETLQTFAFPATSWPAGTTGPYAFTVGAGATTINLSFSIAGSQPFTGGSPNQVTLGNVANTVRTQHNSAGTGVLLATQNVTFSRPVNKLQFVAMDVDSQTFQDQIAPRVNGSVLPTLMTPGSANIVINAAAGTATATKGASQCAATDPLCNVTSNFNTSGITSASQAFITGPLHAQAAQFVGWNSFSWCLPALANITLRKTWVNATLNDTATVAAAGATPALTSLVSVASTVNETDTAVVQTVPVRSILTLAETLTPAGAGANYNSTVACTGTTGLVGNTLTVGATDTNIVCTYTNTNILAAIRITKTDNKAVTTAGGTNAYVVTLTNQGPSAANGVIVSDVVGAGLTCPGTNAVTCTVTGVGAVCPAGPLTIANLTAGLSIATLPSNGALQFAYTCNVN